MERVEDLNLSYQTPGIMTLVRPTRNQSRWDRIVQWPCGLVLDWGSAILGESEVDVAVAWVKPASGDSFRAGVEVHALHAMGVAVAKEVYSITTDGFDPKVLLANLATLGKAVLQALLKFFAKSIGAGVAAVIAAIV